MQAFLESFFQNLGLKVDSLEVVESGEDLNVNIQTPDSALLIGQHGKNIEAFQHLI
jgi:predicted RNA-binding protein Jag